jgi:hypothetical protein
LDRCFIDLGHEVAAVIDFDPASDDLQTLGDLTAGEFDLLAMGGG